MGREGRVDSPTTKHLEERSKISLVSLAISTMLTMTVFLMTVTSGIPPTEQTPIISVYLATMMVLTTTATVLAVLVLRVHHQGRQGLPVPPAVRAMAWWMAFATMKSYQAGKKVSTPEENRRESVNPLGGKEGIELSRMTKRCSSKRQALQDFPKRTENETGIEALST